MALAIRRKRMILTSSRIRSSLLGWLILTTVVPLCHAQSNRRVALVIGENAYTHVSSLNNAVNDANDLNAVLEAHNFTVFRGLNLDRKSLIEALDKFAAAADQADCALFYFAGHGVQSAGQNFLLPVDFPYVPESELWQKAVPVDRVISALIDHQPLVSIVILDACRNNPLRDENAPDQYQRAGLASVVAPLGSLIAFAADAGQEAIDGIDEGASNGLYTSSLISFMTSPGRRIEDIFYETRKTVALKSDGQQTPVEFNKLINTFYFDPPPGVKNLPSVIRPGKPPAQPPVEPQIQIDHPAATALRGYYETVNSRQFPEAYSALSSGFKSRISAAKYQGIYESTLSIYPSRITLTSESATSATIEVNLIVFNSDGQKTKWVGPVQMVKESGNWMFETGKNLKQVSVESAPPIASTPLPVRIANDSPLHMIERYYEAVNLRDFESAYSMLSSGFQNRLGRANFRTNFDQTLSTYLISHQPSNLGDQFVDIELSVIDSSGNRSSWSGPIELAREGNQWTIETMKRLKKN